MQNRPTAEHARLAQAPGADADAAEPWRRWGPYVAERAWGTVREDYSADGDAWDHLTHDEARSTAYRWNEDGLAGICDDQQRLCLGLALWNGVDPILKERVFGLTNGEGNHGEDAKEQWWYVDATPTASWLSWRYRYPQQEFPYDELVGVNGARSRQEPEYELADTGVLDGGFWDVEMDVAKAAPDDLCLRFRVTNRGPAEATAHLLPTLWFRNTWEWGRDPRRPSLTLRDDGAVVARHWALGDLVVAGDGSPTPLFCGNETNTARRFGVPGPAYPKDGINDHVVSGAATVDPAGTGTKTAFWHRLTLRPGQTGEVRLRLAPVAASGAGPTTPDLGRTFEAALTARRAEADEFYADVLAGVPEAEARVARQAFAGLVWGKCFYHYDVARWLAGDAGQPPPPPGRGRIRNGSWKHLANREVLSMPDPWEYPWYAAWDLAFHCVAFAHIDAGFAKRQLLLLCREWYMHPSGQLPAYEWNFSDVNPPVHAWAALQVFHTDGGRDFDFLERVFHKLLLNFTWWVNRVDREGNNVFEGGFLGLDNVGPFDRSKQPPVAGHLEQTDGTAWMAMYCLDLLELALTLALHDRTYSDVATKFFEHFTYIATAMNGSDGAGGDDTGLWDERDGFYYDVLHLDDGTALPMRVRSVVGLVPLAAVRVIDAETLAALPDFAARLHWFVEHRPEVARSVYERRTDGGGEQHLLSVVSPERLGRILSAVLDEDEFLSPHGLRSLSRRHESEPYVADLGHGMHADPVAYEPGESDTGLFGGNSNWRGPVWFPLNRLVIGGLRRFAAYLGDGTTVELPSGSGRTATLDEVADELSRRLVSLFLPAADGRVPAAGDDTWPDGLLWFHEYFHGDTGRGLGASHQTGWTATVADVLLGRQPPLEAP